MRIIQRKNMLPYNILTATAATNVVEVKNSNNNPVVNQKEVIFVFRLH